MLASSDTSERDEFIMLIISKVMFVCSLPLYRCVNPNTSLCFTHFYVFSGGRGQIKQKKKTVPQKVTIAKIPRSKKKYVTRVCGLGTFGKQRFSCLIRPFSPLFSISEARLPLPQTSILKRLSGSLPKSSLVVPQLQQRMK